MPKGWKTLTIREEVFKAFKEVYEERRKPYTSFASWASQYLLERIEEDRLLSRYAPALSFIGITNDNAIAIDDSLIDRIVEVEIRPEEKILYCRKCETDNCRHVGFAFAIREVNKVLIEKGFKIPKKIE